MSTPTHPDTGDVIDPAAPDPTPDEITDPEHPDYAAPYANATPTAVSPADEEV
jgi:hypothetical protein